MFDLVFSHDDFIIINKHPNISVHKDDGDTMLLKEISNQTGDEQLYLVHRLDKMTSGLLLVARNVDTARELSQQFALRRVEKFYLAIGAGKPKKKQGLVRGDMVRSRRSSWKLVKSSDNPAMTQFFSTAAGSGLRLYLCKPHTGKTHQIRVALKSIGAAILGDPIYSGLSASDRGYLHAFALCFWFEGEHYQFVYDPRNQPHLGKNWNNNTVSLGVEPWLKPWELLWPKIQ
jgi:tRNA pseudouridine32 synthase/23S rRNA pseudouridine746 synthase